MKMTPHTNAEIRFNNYVILVNSFKEDEIASGMVERGSLKRFGNHCGISPFYLSHINNLRKQIGSNLARTFEKAFNKPVGWMDVAQQDNSIAVIAERTERDEMQDIFFRAYDAYPKEFYAAMNKFLIEKISGDMKR